MTLSLNFHIHGKDFYNESEITNGFCNRCISFLQKEIDVFVIGLFYW